MKTSTFKQVAIFLLCCYRAAGFAQNEEPVFSQLTREAGFPSGAAQVTIMDKKGFAWIGMRDGLVRWDGRQFERFQTTKGDTFSLPCTFVRDLLEDADGSIWVATIGGGICRFDPVTRRFHRYPVLRHDPGSLSDPNAWALYLDSAGDLWVGVFNSGLNRLNRRTNAFEPFPLITGLKNEQEAFRRNTVRDIIEDIGDPGVLWLATNDGLVRFHKKDGAVQHFSSPAPRSAGLPVNTVFMDQPGKIWLGTAGGGMARFDTHTFDWTYFPAVPEAWEKRNTRENVVLDVLARNGEELWVCTQDRGFGIFNRRTGAYRFFKNRPGDLTSVLANTANSVFKDAGNRLWITHFDKGISLLSPDRPPFSFHSLPPGNCRSYENGRITGFAYHPGRKQYFVTAYACDGLYLLDSTRRLIRKIPAEGMEGAYMMFQTVKSDRRGRVWVGAVTALGTVQGNYPAGHALWTLLPGEPKLRPFTHRALPQQAFNVFDIHEDRAGNLWLATDYYGLMKIDFARDTIEAYVKSPACPDAPSAYVHVRQILEDDRERLWLATQGEGVFCFDPSTRRFQQRLNLETGYNGQAETRVNALTLDDQGQVWLGTSGNGIQWLDPHSPDRPIVAQLAGPEGLPSPRIFNLARAAEGSIWVTTEGGLCRFDPQTGKFVVFGPQDGVAGIDFYEQGLEILSTGEVFIGQDTGFYVFDPSAGLVRPNPQEPVFSSFKVFEQERFFGKDLNYLDCITLTHKENFFTISFSDLDYDGNGEHPFAYRLEGYDPDWVFPQDPRRSATYTDVPPGKYTFRVRNAGNLAGSPGIALRIVVRPPYWQRWWAYTAYLILFLAGTYGLYRIRLLRGLEKAEARRLQQLDAFKTRFFANISHEFRTPLTLLIGPTENALKRWADMKPEDWRELSHTTLRNGRRLLNLVNQLLDLARIEAGKLALQATNGELVSFLRYQLDSCRSFADTKRIRLQFETETPELPMAFDAEKMQTILANLLSNALKFTPEGGCITVRVEADQASGQAAPASVRFTVSDTGIGIPGPEMDRIFDRFHQVDSSRTRQAEGAGIGLALVWELVQLMKGRIRVESRVGAGSSFHVTLPYAPPSSRTRAAMPENGHLGTSTASWENHGPYPQPEVAGARIENSTFLFRPSTLPLLLIVEDNADVRHYLAACVRNEYRIVMAENGAEGIEKALALVPDIIISDVMMPEKDGLELCATLKNDERTSHVPIVLLTARVDVDSRLAGLRRGADVYLAKPFESAELQAHLHNLVGLRRRLQQRYANLGQLPEAAQDPELALEDAFLLKIREVVLARLSDGDFEMPQLAREVGMSYSQLFRKIKALTDATPSTFIRAIRLGEAKALLRNSTRTIAEIAYEVGFSSPAYFSRSFSEEFGQTPSEFRQG